MAALLKDALEQYLARLEQTCGQAPGTIRRRGKGWQVILRVNGDRHRFGPRTEELRRDGCPERTGDAIRERQTSGACLMCHAASVQLQSLT